MNWSYIILIAVFALMMIMMILPQKKREKQMKELRNNLEVGDTVVTECGITGKVMGCYFQRSSRIKF